VVPEKGDHREKQRRRLKERLRRLREGRGRAGGAWRTVLIPRESIGSRGVSPQAIYGVVAINAAWWVQRVLVWWTGHGEQEDAGAVQVSQFPVSHFSPAVTW
jgi:hypothetical protein